MVTGGEAQIENIPDAPNYGPNKVKDNDQTLSLKQGLHQFIVTMKNMALYPETSQTNRQASSQLLEWMSFHMNTYGPIILLVAKDTMLTDYGEPIYNEKPNDQILAFPLFRDGVQSIIFEPGLTEEELRMFIDIMLRFKTATENDQDDVVTSMWEAAFNYIKYTIADEYEEVSPEFDTGAMVCSRPPVNRPDIDAPYQALAPPEVEGTAPVAKSIGSLFALADTLDFSFAPGGADGRVEDPHAGGKLLPDNATEPEGLEDDGFEPFGDSGNDWEEDEDGFSPFQNSTGLNKEDMLPTPDGGLYHDEVPGRVRKGVAPKDPATLGEGGGAGGAGAGGGNGSDSGNGKGPGGNQGSGTDVNDQNTDGQGVMETYLDEDGDEDFPMDNPFSQTLQNIDLSSLSMDDFDDNTEISAPVTRPEEEDKLDVDEETKANRAQRLKFWGLSSREIKQVSALIQWDEARSKSYSVLSMILILLKSPVLKNNMRPAIVSFICEEITEAIKKKFLAGVNEFLAEFQELSESSKRLTVSTIYEDLKNKLNNLEFLTPLIDLSNEEKNVVDTIYDDLRYFLYQLPPSSIFTLAKLLPEIKSLKIKHLFIELIAWNIPRTQENLAKLAPELNEWTIITLISLLKAMRVNVPTQLASSFSRHGSATIRDTIAKYILENEKDNLQIIAHLIIDPDPKIRDLVTPRLTRKRDQTVESILYNFLAEKYALKQNKSDVLEYYKAFGLSANFRSITFLSEILLKKDFSSFFGSSKDYHRTGAAVALLLMPTTTGSDEIIHRASKSAFRSVRRAVEEARKYLDRN
jgi:hypothetical protein